MFLPLLLPPVPPPPDLNPPIAIVQVWTTAGAHPFGDIDRRTAHASAFTPIPASPASPESEDRGQQGAEPVEIKLLSDSGPTSANWRQQFSITINRGGSLTEAANRLWGDPSEENVNRLFEAARKRYPELNDPSRIGVGQQFVIEIDPTRSFILANVERLSNPDRTVRKFTNGAVETRYATPQRGIVRVIDFPVEGGHEYEFHDGKETVTVPSGSTLVNYEYQAGQSFEEVVQATYGQRSVAAMADFTTKTGWRSQNWPPEAGASKQIVVSRQANFVDESVRALKVAVPDPSWQQAIDRIAAERAALGIVPVDSDADSTRYLVRIVRADITVEQVTRLLYGRPDQRWDEILRAAGASPNEQGAREKTVLLGSGFQLDVPFIDEPIIERRDNELRLASGTRVIGSGASLIAYYPSGFRELRYRPDSWLALLVGAYQLAWETVRDPGAPKAEIQQRADRGTAEILWQWDPANPRRTTGDVAQEVSYLAGRPGRIPPEGAEMRALIKPPGLVTPAERVEADLRRFPFLIPLAGFAALVVIGGVLSLVYRVSRRQTPPSPVILRRRARARLRFGRP